LPLTIERLLQISESMSASPAQVALAFLLHKPFVTSVVVGARSPQQLVETLAADDLELTPEAIVALDELSASPLPYPYWHQARTITARLGAADKLALSGAAKSAPKPQESNLRDG
jgi:diketogulonate reductase-like aldo/keto reductase